MRQALHIFRKDTRHLWPEIAVALLVTALFTVYEIRYATELVVMQLDLARLLLPLAWWTLIARVIHSEPLAGDRQFWLTRPYARRSLLAAKALFILAWVNVPTLVAHAVIVGAAGFSIRGEIPGLLWSQVLLTAVFMLPMAALAAITTGFVQLLFTVLVFSAACLGLYMVYPMLMLGAGWALAWIPSYYAGVVIAVAALAILAWQYARRRTLAARSLAAAALVLALLGATLLPWTAAFAIQSRISRKRIDPSAVRVGFNSARTWAARLLLLKSGRAQFDLPLQIAGVPAGLEASPDGLTVTIEAPGGPVWRSGNMFWARVSTAGRLVSLQAEMDGSFYKKVRNTPVTLRGSLYLTLYGNRRAASIPSDGQAVPVPGVGLCSATQAVWGRINYFVRCRSAFRSPRRLMSAHFSPPRDGRIDQGDYVLAFQQEKSYSPFPAELDVSPLNQQLANSVVYGGASALAVVTIEPVAHIRRDFVIPGLRLADLEPRPPSSLPPLPY